MDFTEVEKNELSDELLCSQAVAGDRLAEEHLVMRYMRLARACARPYFLAGGDNEDLLQEAMFGLLKAIREFEPGRDSSFATFAEICVRNRIKSAVSAAARKKHTPLNTSVSIEVGLLEKEDVADPEEDLIIKEEEAERLTALNKRLSSLEQRILALYLRGFSYQEIGLRLKCADKSVDNAIQRIRRKVAGYLGDISES